VSKAHKRAALGGSVGPAPKSEKITGEFRDPGERPGGQPWLRPWYLSARALEEKLGVRREDEEVMPKRSPHYLARRADGGGVTDTMSPVDLLRLRRELDARRRVSDQQRAETGLQTIHEVAGMLPVTGNAMAAADAYTAGRDALAAARKGRWREAATEAGIAGISGLGALSPVPWGRSAGRAAAEGADMARVLVPVEDGGARVAREMREAGVAPDRIWRETRRTPAPDGSIRREIPDQGIELKRDFKPGDVEQLSRAVRHPKLFAAHPELMQRPLYITDELDSLGAPVARTTDTGAFVLNPRAKVRASLAKMLQYEVNKGTGLATPVRHGTKALQQALDSAITRADALDVTDPATRRAIDDYLDVLADQREHYGNMRAMESYGKRGPVSDAAARVAEKSAGNLEGKIAALRSGSDEAGMHQWPYRRVGSYLKGSQQLPKFDDVYALPPEGMEGDELLRFIQRWHSAGAGRSRYARGGRVKSAARRARAVVGAVKGKTGGRSDKLPVDVPAGSYVIPADVVAALGEGNTEAGMQALDAKLGRPRRAGGGRAVPILISHGEYVVSPELVERIGGADVLDQFVVRARNAYADQLKGLPGPNK
jgi:hypothetical protein